MKFILFLVVLVCSSYRSYVLGNSSGNQKDSASSCTHVNINVNGNGEIKDSRKPSAHIKAQDIVIRTYQGNQVIKDWNLSHPDSHLLGGMSYQSGKLVVPKSGRYYIYAQIFFQLHGNPVMIHVNNKRIIVIQPPSGGRNRVTMYAGGLFNLRANDVITVLPDGYTTRLYMCADCSYFGAFLI